MAEAPPRKSPQICLIADVVTSQISHIAGLRYRCVDDTV
jgi:hypothetical protein